MCDKLPDKIIDIDVIRANWNFKKKCECQNRTFVLDPRNREVHCGQCGELIDPFDAMLELANNYERINNQLHSALEQKKKLDRYKSHLEVLKYLEGYYKGKNKMIPHCPVCGEPFYLEELRSWSCWSYGEAKIKKRLEEKKNK